jgi:hypothetical protein
MTKTESLPNANQTQSDIFPGTLLQDKFKIIELLQNSPNSSCLLLSVMTQEAEQFFQCSCSHFNAASSFSEIR